MQWLSAAVDVLVERIDAGEDPRYDVVIVGSGYGGAVAAARYARAGLRVCVLERGREYVPGEFPNDIATLPRHVRLERPDKDQPIGRADALFDVRTSGDVTVLVGNALGGTSQINANVALRADPGVLRSDPWPAAFRREDASLDPYYALAEQMLGVNAVPDKLAKRERLFELGRHVAQHVRETVLDEDSQPDTQCYAAPITVTLEDRVNAFGVEQKACVLCGDCVTGCNYGAKNTLTMNYLADARAHGADLYTGASVVAVEPGGGTRVYFGRNGEIPKWQVPAPVPEGLWSLAASTVILAAGSLGSTEILLRSRELKKINVSDTLGSRFSGNGDALAFGFEHAARVGGVGWGWRQQNVDAKGTDGEPLGPVGPTITGVIDARRGVPRAKGVVIQDGAIPGPLAKFFQELLTTAASIEQLDRFRPLAPAGETAAPRARTLSHSQTLLAMGHDDSQGRLRLARDRVRIEWPKAAFQRVTEWQSELMGLSSRLGGVYLYNPLHWPLPDRIAKILSGPTLRGTPIIVHPLGGCPMAERCDLGVVNDRGAVFDCATPDSTHKGLYVWDGSIIPGALGVNPLLTIAALAERNVALDLEARGRFANHDLPSAPAVRLPPRPAVAAYRPPAAQRTDFDWQETLRGPLRWLGGPGQLNAELRIALPLADVDGFLSGKQRRVEIDRWPGRDQWLRTDTAVPEKLRTFDVEDGGWFTMAEPRPRKSLLAVLVQLIRCIPTALVVAWKRRFDIVRWILGRGAAIPWRSVPALVYRAAEVREMRYAVRLRERSTSRAYVLRGRKRFAQSLGNNVWQSLVDLRVVLWRCVTLAGWRVPVFPVACGHLALDALALSDERTPQFSSDVDLANAFQSLARVPLFLVRALLPIYWWDFKLPDYPSRARQIPRMLGAQRVVERDGSGGYKAAQPARRIEPERHWVTVRRSIDSEPADPTTLPLVLTRFKRDDGTPVLLLHGFGQSSMGFGVQTIPANLIEVLWSEGFDVWLLDYRTSIALPSAYEQHDLDQVARIDVPCAVDYVRHATGCARLHVMGHCMGGAVLAMSLLEGLLEGKISKAVISQVPPFIVGGSSAQARRQVAALVRDVIGWEGVDLAADDRAGALWTAIDRLLATFPASVRHGGRTYDERCPGEHRWFLPRTDSATCKRVTAIVGRTFRHGNVNEATHRQLDQLFGWCNITIFNQIAKFFEYERIVDREGVNRYLSEEAIGAHLDLPIAFVHGAENELFDLKSSERTLEVLTRINGAGNYRSLFVEGYGHYDCMIGEKAHELVFAPVADFLRNFEGRSQEEAPPPIELRVPRLGPLLGWVRKEQEKRVVTLWAKPDFAATPTPLYAVTAVYDSENRLCDVRQWPLLDSGRRKSADAEPCLDEDGQPIALADVELPDGEGDFRIRMLFAYRTVHANGIGQPPATLPGEPIRRTARTMQQIDAALRDRPAPRPPEDAADVIAFAEAVHEQLLQNQENEIRPILSRTKRRRVPFADCEARISKRLLEADATAGTLRFLAGTCRYPGTMLDSARSDAVFAHILQRFRDSGICPQFLLMCGDQIYADATAGLFDVTERLEKFSARYRAAWGSPHFRRLARELPVRMVMDDHEIDDNWSAESVRDAQTRKIARWGKAAFLAYQRSHGPRDPNQRWDAFDYRFDASGLPFYVLDTRSDRHKEPRRARAIMSRDQLRRLTDWLQEQQVTKGDAPKFIVSGSVFAPGLRDAGYAESNDPHPHSYPRRADGWQAFPEDRAALISAIAECGAQNVVFVSGDYHCSARVRMCIENQGVRLDAYAIVVRPFYAPFHFASENSQTIIHRGVVSCSNGTKLTYAGEIAEGPGFCEITVSRNGGWRIEVQEVDASGHEVERTAWP